MRRPEPARRPRGFTLVELLVVVVIVAVLIALLVPAIAGAVRAANSAAVQAEINTLAQALAAFKGKFGDYPPSRIMLNESGYLDTTSIARMPTGPAYSAALPTADVTQGQLAQRSLTAMRKFFPRATFTTSPGAAFPANSPRWYDFNGNGVNNAGTVGVLQGHECLVFFLGGIPLADSTGTFAMIGFGKDPTNPFSNGIIGNSMHSANRNAPYFEFKSERLVLTAPLSIPIGYTAPLSGIPGYIDSIDGKGDGQSFYAYFSTNLGSGYDPNDVNLGGDEYSATSGIAKPLYLKFLSSQPVTPQTLNLNVTASATPNPYTTGAPFGGTTAVQYQSPQSFQIISPGIDGFYGLGGMYAPTSEAVLPSQKGIDSTGDDGVRTLEFDNLTNFHNGRLQ